MKRKVVIPPVGAATKDECEHRGSRPTDFRCPDCEGILRRCCNSILSYAHAEFCAYVAQRAVAKAQGTTVVVTG